MNFSAGNVNKVVELGLCNGCGTCFSICPYNAISFSLDAKKGILFAKVNRQKCTDCGLCLAICPSLEITVNNANITGKLLGNYVALYYGYSCDEALRYKAASGGVTSTILKYLVENNIVDGVVLVRPLSKSPFLHEAFITNNIHDIYRYAGVRYFPVPVNKILKEIKGEKGKFAIVGTPCQMYGIHKLSKLNKELQEKVYLKIGFFCGGTPNLNSYVYYMYVHKLKPEKLISIYRGISWPGHDVFEYQNGEKILVMRRPRGLIDQAHYALSFFPIFAQKRCLVCVDRFASYADISVGDAWLDRFRRDSKGTSLIVVRNNKADELLKDIREKGYLCYDKILETEILESQKIFSYFYKNFYTTTLLFSDIFSSKTLQIKVPSYIILPRRLSYRWLILVLLLKLGMRLSRNKFLWKQLYIYGLLFNLLRRFLI